MGELDREELLARYAEPHRRYHTAEHVEEVLAAVDALRDLAADPAAVELAAWMHDAVYDPRAPAGANEEASARLALARVGGPRGEEVARLIRLTADHTCAAGDANGAVLLDADLWILGAPPARYERYRAGVRAEYGHLDDEAWRVWRSGVLRALLARPRLYVTHRFRDRLEPQARRNLAGELAALGGGEPEA